MYFNDNNIEINELNERELILILEKFTIISAFYTLLCNIIKLEKTDKVTFYKSDNDTANLIDKIIFDHQEIMPKIEGLISQLHLKLNIKTPLIS